jgi:hypothetical protein
LLLGVSIINISLLKVYSPFKAVGLVPLCMVST